MINKKELLTNAGQIQAQTTRAMNNFCKSTLSEKECLKSFAMFILPRGQKQPVIEFTFAKILKSKVNVVPKSKPKKRKLSMTFRAIDLASFPDVVKNGSQIETQTALDAFTERPDLISRGEPFTFSLGGWSFNALLVLY